MKKIVGLMLVAMAVLVVTGCSETGETGTATGGPAEVTKVVLEADLCGKCGCCAGCEDCCKGEKCEKCEMQKGTLLCCTGVKPAEVVYCKDCGFEKGTETCCAEANVACTKCGLAEGSTLCCKIKPTGDASHDHDEDHAHGDGEDEAEE